ncbi:hypothetical protein Tco_0267211, partial [Tanacetum coccineum]
METIHVKFDELTTMASEHSCLEPETNRFNTDDSSVEFTTTPSIEDLDNLFGLIYEEYFEKRSPEVSINSVSQTTLNNDDEKRIRDGVAIDLDAVAQRIFLGFFYDGYSPDAVTNSLTWSLDNPDGVASNPDAVSTF